MSSTSDALAHSDLRKPKDTHNDSALGVNADSPSSNLDEKKPLIANESKSCPSNATSSGPSLTTKGIEFAANATPKTLTGVAVGFAAVTYVVLGRLGLVLIGAFGGVLGFIAWEARNPEVSRIVRGERGLDVVERLQLDAIKLKHVTEQAQNEEHDEQFAIKALDEFRPETREALGGLIDSIVRDYVKWWYNPLIPNDHSFPLACRKALVSYILAISNHMSRKRPADAFLDLLTNSSSMIIVFMSELANAFSELPPESNMTAADVIYNYLAEHPESHLTNLLNSKQQSARFRMVAEDLLMFLDRDNHSCDPARMFLREIISNSVLENILQSCSKPEWINGWIVYLLEAGEPDLSQAIDVGMQRDPMSMAFADMDGNVGNMPMAKPSRGSLDSDRGSRRKDSVQSHRRVLSKADEEMEGFLDNEKRPNSLSVLDDSQRRRRSSTIRESVESPKPSGKKATSRPKSSISEDISPTTPSFKKANPKANSTDGSSDKSESILTPDGSSQGSSPRKSLGSQFNNFDQVAPKVKDEEPPTQPQKKAPLTLHNASFTMHDDDGDGTKIRNKPTWDYLVQVEPSSSHYSGWMIVRRYSDFETLHEILRRIAAISGATAFVELHKNLPSWRMHTRESLRGELERYLRDACWYQSLAESEGMKRFLEKSQGHTHGETKTFAWETVGKNMLDVLTVGPKGAMDTAGKTIVGGVQGVFGNFPGLGKKPSNTSVDLNVGSNRASLVTPPRMENARSPARSERASIESQRSSVVSQQPGKMAPMERRQSYQSQQGDEGDYFRMGRAERMDSVSVAGSTRPSREHSRASSLAPVASPASMSLENLRLPPHPDEIPDDYEMPHSNVNGNGNPGSGMPRSQSADSLSHNNGRNSSMSTMGASLNSGKGPKPSRQYFKLSEPETRVAVELLFAMINEMYTLSSAWNIRRTLLTAAKSFLLRPGNPSLVAVQSIIQTSVLDPNTSDAGLASHLRKIRENVMPTEAERASWPSEMTDEEKEKLRIKARQLLIRSGVPAALMGVMGQAATSDALGRLFDSLQIEEVARGLVFGLLLQIVRLVTH